MIVDLSESELVAYRSAQVEPRDFDEFWSQTLSEAQERAFQPRIDEVDSAIATLQIFDVTFSGFAGQPVRGWLRVPRAASTPLPAVIEFVGYGRGRGLPEEDLFWSSAGFAHLQMDSRGQGAAARVGDTSDVGSFGPRVPGMMTMGIGHRDDYYYRRLITDAVRAVEVASTLPLVDPASVTALGSSQGGGLALAATALSRGVTTLVSMVPFLCDFPRAIMITDSDPYKEISRFLATRRHEEARVLDTLSYFDGVNFARRATARAYFTAGLMDAVCPPSTVYGAFNAYRGPKEIKVWRHNGHEGGGSDDLVRMAHVLRAGRPGTAATA
jgi:cephalosporin-C deacetylase